jgi:hypothetical protein
MDVFHGEPTDITNFQCVLRSGFRIFIKLVDKILTDGEFLVSDVWK